MKYLNSMWKLLTKQQDINHVPSKCQTTAATDIAAAGGGSGTKKVEPFWILMKQEMVGWQLHQLDDMQIIYTSLKTDNL